ncbi:MAG: YbhB/YbcL family Raf kinase inhibitor-like protein [Patescibacteria group bacterium]
MKRLWILVGLLGILLLATLQSGFWPQNSLKSQDGPASMRISSSAFGNDQAVPVRFTCNGKNVNPALIVSGVPERATSLVLIVDDPDAPFGVFTHWLLWNIPPETKNIEEGEMPEGAVSGLNSFGKPGYNGPCPASGLHRYFFTVIALDSFVGLNGQASRSELENAMRGHMVGEAHFYGRYNARSTE